VGWRRSACLACGLLSDRNRAGCLCGDINHQRPAIEALVAEYGLTGRASALRRNSMACVALPTCGLALAESERYLPSLVTALDDSLHNAESQLPEEVRTKFLADFDKDFKGTMRVVVGGMVHETTDAELKEWLVTRAQAQDPKMVALMRDLFGLDTVTAFKEAKVPVRCINSGGGFQFFTPTAVETNKKCADFGAVIIDGVGHYPMLESRLSSTANSRSCSRSLRSKK
jgi:hypothetical protein